MQQVNHNLTPESDRHNAGQPDTNFDGSRLGTDAFGTPGVVVPSQQGYETIPHGGIGAGQQRGTTTVDQSQKHDDQVFDTMDKRGVGTGLGAGHTVGDFSTSTENTNPFRDEVTGNGQNTIGRRGNQNGGNSASLAMRQEERERDGTNPGSGWQGGGVTGGNALDGSRQGGGFGNNTGDTGRHGTEAGAAAGAVAGLARGNHTKDGRSDEGLYDNVEQRQRERDFAGTHSGTGIDANAGYDAQGLGLNPMRDSTRGTTVTQPHGASTLGTPSEQLPGAYGGGTGSTTGHQGGTGAGKLPGSIPSAFGGGTGLASGLQGATAGEHASRQVPGAEPAVTDLGKGTHGTGSELHGGKGGDHTTVAGAQSGKFGSEKEAHDHGSGPGVGGAGAQSTGSGTTDIVIGKLEQGAGKLLNNDMMRAKGLEKEAKGEALRDVPHAQQLVQEAATLRERAGQKNSGKDTNETKNGGGIEKGHDRKSERV